MRHQRPQFLSRLAELLPPDYGDADLWRGGAPGRAGGADCEVSNREDKLQAPLTAGYTEVLCVPKIGFG